MGARSAAFLLLVLSATPAAARRGSCSGVTRLAPGRRLHAALLVVSPRYDAPSTASTSRREGRTAKSSPPPKLPAISTHPTARTALPIPRQCRSTPHRERRKFQSWTSPPTSG